MIYGKKLVIFARVLAPVSNWRRPPFGRGGRWIKTAEERPLGSRPRRAAFARADPRRSGAPRSRRCCARRRGAAVARCGDAVVARPRESLLSYLPPSSAAGFRDASRTSCSHSLGAFRGSRIRIIVRLQCQSPFAGGASAFRANAFSFIGSKEQPVKKATTISALRSGIYYFQPTPRSDQSSPSLLVGISPY